YGPSPLVGELVELAHDLGPALCRVQLERLERRAVVLLEPIARRHLPPDAEDVVSQGQFFGIEVAKARQGLGLHGGNLIPVGDRVNVGAPAGDGRRARQSAESVTSARPSAAMTSPTV